MKIGSFCAGLDDRDVLVQQDPEVGDITVICGKWVRPI